MERFHLQKSRPREKLIELFAALIHFLYLCREYLNPQTYEMTWTASRLGDVIPNECVIANECEAIQLIKSFYRFFWIASSLRSSQ